MKLITAIIKPFKLDDVREALSEVSARYDSRGQGLRATEGSYRIVSRSRIRRDFLPKVKIEAA